MSPFENYDDLARLEYGRLLWRNPASRRMLLDHWTDPRHPYRERFLEKRALIERVLDAGEGEGPDLEKDLAARGTSLRAVSREIPPVFGHFWGRRGADEPPPGSST